MKKAIETLKRTLDTFKGYFMTLPIYGKLVFIIVFLIGWFVIPNVVSMPIIYKFVEWHNKKRNERNVVE